MNAEQHRRLIGNDVVFIIFHDNECSFDPSPLNALGTVPQVFGVVQKYQELYYRYFTLALVPNQQARILLSSEYQALPPISAFRQRFP